MSTFRDTEEAEDARESPKSYAKAGEIPGRGISINEKRGILQEGPSNSPEGLYLMQLTSLIGSYVIYLCSRAQSCSVPMHIFTTLAHRAFYAAKTEIRRGVRANFDW